MKLKEMRPNNTYDIRMLVVNLLTISFMVMHTIPLRCPRTSLYLLYSMCDKPEVLGLRQTLGRPTFFAVAFSSVYHNKDSKMLLIRKQCLIIHRPSSEIPII